CVDPGERSRSLTSAVHAPALGLVLWCAAIRVFVEDPLSFAPLRAATLGGGYVTAVAAHILVADDRAENLHLLLGLLEEQGHDVRAVTSGRAALAAAEADPPDLILLDVHMPDMLGYEVCTELKARPSLREVPVIFLTALSGLADKVRGFNAGGVDYITKPFQLDEVTAR